MFKKILAFSALVAIFGGCSSIKEPYTLRSVPSNAKVVVIDADTNKTLDQGQTPYKFSYKKYADLYNSKSYIVNVSKEGYKTMKYRITPDPDNYSKGKHSKTIWELEPETKEYVWHDELNVEVLLTDDKEAQKKLKLRKLAK